MANLTEKKASDYWKRHGLVYVARLNVYAGIAPYYPIMEVVRRLDLISYHLIRLIHGDQALVKMATDPPKIDWVSSR